MLGKQNIMIDIEALGLMSDSVILQIGAVEFDGSGVQHEFEANTDVATQISAGRTTLARAIKWWVDEHPKTFFEICGSVASPLASVLNDLCAWVGDKEDWADMIVWANGTDFDISILNHAFKTYGMKTPWGYSNVRDYRTIRKYFGHLMPPAAGKYVASHTALADARAQAEHLIRLSAAIKGAMK